MTMRSAVDRIPDPIYPATPMIVEHTTLDELSRVFLAHVRATGLLESSETVRAAHGELMEIATLTKLSTWGEVLRLDGAEILLARALQDLGIAGVSLPDDRVLH